MNRLKIMVGLPGSGKSTFVNFYKEDDDVVISSDALRVEMFGFEDQTHNNEVFKEMLSRTKSAGLMNKTVWYDATNLSRKRRVALYKDTHNFFDEIIVFCVTPSIEVILERNIIREERHLPEEKLKQLIKSFQAPVKYESSYVDEIFFVYSGYNNAQQKQNWVDKYKNYNQENKHHTQTLGDHILTVMNYCKEDKMAYLAAEYHDIGKEFCQVRKENGECHYFGHSAVSSYIFISEQPQRKDIDTELVTLLIEFHDQIFSHDMNFAKLQDSIVKKYPQLPTEFFNSLKLLTEGDRIRPIKKKEK